MNPNDEFGTVDRPAGLPPASDASWFDSRQRMEALRHVAARWIGTPWMANSAVCGAQGGVSCHRLPQALYTEVGALPLDYPTPYGNPNENRYGTTSTIQSWLEGRAEFRRLPVSVGQVRSGDLLGIRIHRCLDHLAVALDPWHFVHVLLHQRTTTDSLRDPTWSRRLLAVWRLPGSDEWAKPGGHEARTGLLRI